MTRINVEDDFQLLLEMGNIGFYKTAELLSIFIIKSGNPINVFTRVTLDESDETSNIKYITDELVPISKDISVGIITQKISICEVKTIFEDLISNNELEIDGGQIEIDKLSPVNKVIVPSLNNVSLRNALKSFINDSYILEFFSEDVTVINNHLDDKQYKKLCDIINNNISIDFLFLRDRIGNIIFQFPITLIKAKARFISDNVIINSALHSLLKEPLEVEIFAYITHDNNIVGSASYIGDLTPKLALDCGNSDGDPVIFIKNVKTGLYLFFADYFASDIGIGIEVATRERIRTIVLDRTYNVYIKKCESVLAGISTKPYIKRIKERKYEEFTESLKEQKEFIQYGVDGIDENLKALSDIKAIIEKNCKKGIYIWDPYAMPEDILKTAYFCSCSNSEIKVITNSKWESSDINHLISNSNHEKIKLEVRGSHDTAWSFHDRFLIFPGSKYDNTKVWSLGSSINSIGRIHSILHEVKNAQNILDAFNKLWKKLDSATILQIP